MHKEKQKTTVRVADSFRKTLFHVGIMSMLLLGCTGCGKKDTVYFLEETLSQTEDEQTEEEQTVSLTEQMPEQEETGAAAASCFVHICGAVERPGVYELPEGSRIFEAVKLAGGLTEEACEEYQNQAQKITDGMKIYIPTAEQVENGEAEETFLEAEPEGTKDTQNTDKTVNINTADKELLMTLPGIGENRAESIISYREEKGSFVKIEDIMQVSGIKDGAYQKLKDKICVD